MIARLLLCSALLVAMPLGAQERQGRGMAADRNVAIRLWVPAGFVEVQGWDHDSIDVRLTPAAGTTMSGGGTRSATKFSLETTRGDSVLASATMRVRVPRAARVWIKSTTASVSVQGVRGELDVMQVSGSTTVTDGMGVVRIEAIAGDVTLTRLAGSVVVRGGAGRNRLNGVSGTLEASSVSGQILLGSDSLPVVARLETVGGAVQLIGAHHAASQFTIATHDGPISIFTIGAPFPRIEASVPGATLPQSVRNANGSGGSISVRSFKGTLNVVTPNGI